MFGNSRGTRASCAWHGLVACANRATIEGASAVRAGAKRRALRAAAARHARAIGHQAYLVLRGEARAAARDGCADLAGLLAGEGHQGRRRRGREGGRAGCDGASGNPRLRHVCDLRPGWSGSWVSGEVGGALRDWLTSGMNETRLLKVPRRGTLPA